MHSTARAIYQIARDAHAQAFDQLVRLQRAVNASGNQTELVDSIYALREASKLADDLKKELNKALELQERLVCLAWASTSATGEPIRTEYCTGSPDIKQTPKTPKPGSPEYDLFCAHYGVDPNAPFRPHWPSILQKVSEDLKAGKQIPPGCDPNDMWSVFKVGTRKKKPIDGTDLTVGPAAARRIYERDAKLQRMAGNDDYTDFQALCMEALMDSVEQEDDTDACTLAEEG